MLLRKFIEVEPPSMTLGEAYHARPGMRSTFAVGDGVVGARSGAVTFNTHLYPTGSQAASGDPAQPSPLSGLLVAAGYDEVIGTSSTTTVGSTTSDIKLVSGSHENHHVGGAVVYNGHLRWVTSKADGDAGADTISVTPPLPVAPATGGTLYAVRTYKKSVSGDVPSATIEVEIDGVLHTFLGCKGNVTFNANEAGPLMCAWDFQATHHIEEVGSLVASPDAAYPTTAPALSHDREFYVGTTRTNVGGLTWTLGAQVQPRGLAGNDAINNVAGFQLTNYASRVALSERPAVSLVAIMGTHGKAVAVRVPAARLIERPTIQNQSDMAAVPQSFEAQDAGVVAWDADGDSDNDTIDKLPDVAIAIA
jgi:hypothetical protein